MARKVSPFDRLSKQVEKLAPDLRFALAAQIIRNLDGGTEQIGKLADEMKRRAYHSEIRSMAQEFKKEIIAGEYETSDDLMTRIHETVDGHHDVIYTGCAMDVVCTSDNSGAYVEDFGTEGVIENGDLAWSRLAYAAMHRDLLEQLDAEGVDVNADPPCVREEE